MAGRALRTEIRRLGDIRKVFEVYASQVEHDQMPDETQGGAELYDRGLSYIVEASLVQCEQWVEKSRNRENVQNLFRSLCVLEKQMIMPESILSMVWGLSLRKTDRVVHNFADLGLITKTANPITSEKSSNEIVKEYGVRLHYLVLLLCQELADDGQEVRHRNVIDALKPSKSVWVRDEIPATEEWWHLKNIGYIYGNLSRHMVKCGQRQALANLLADVRWTLRRIKIDGWLSLEMDFELLFAVSDYADLRQVYEVLKRNRYEVSREERFLLYFIGGSLSRRERKNKYTAMYIDSMAGHLSRPFLVPRSKIFGPQGDRELSLLSSVKRSDVPILVDFSCSTGIAVLVVDFREISALSVCAQKELRSLSLPFTMEGCISCVAISPNGEQIVSGHYDGTIIQWDSRSGEPVGIGINAHDDGVTCLAISKDGSTIVTGSEDKTLRLWNAKHSEPKGKPMKHESGMECVAICESGSLIVSASRSGKVCRWNVETCAMIGEPMCGLEHSVRCVAVIENGKMIVSGPRDKTLGADARAVAACSFIPTFGFEPRTFNTLRVHS